MRSYLDCASVKIRVILKTIDAVTEADRARLQILGPEHPQLSNTVYHVLSMTTKVKALYIVQSVEEGCGRMAWWRLHVEM